MSYDVGEVTKGLKNEPYLRLISFSNPFVASPTSQLMSSTHSQIFPSLYLSHSSFSNPSVASPTSQLFPTLLSLLLRHKPFTYVTWRAAHTPDLIKQRKQLNKTSTVIWFMLSSAYQNVFYCYCCYLTTAMYYS